MSKAVMDTHSMIFVTIRDLVSPSGSVNGDPLFDFPDHCKPRFSTRFPLCWESEGADWPAPSERKICPVSAARESRAVKPWGLLSRSCHLRDKMFTHRRGVDGLAGPRFLQSPHRCPPQTLFSSYPTPAILSV